MNILCYRWLVARSCNFHAIHEIQSCFTCWCCRPVGISDDQLFWSKSIHSTSVENHFGPSSKVQIALLFLIFQNLAWSWALHSSNHNSLILNVGTKNVIPNLDLDFFQLRPVRWLARQAPIRGYYRSPQYTIGAFVLAASDLPFDKILSFIIQFWDIFVRQASVHFKHNTSQGCPFLCVSSWIWLG